MSSPFIPAHVTHCKAMKLRMVSPCDAFMLHYMAQFADRSPVPNVMISILPQLAKPGGKPGPCLIPAYAGLYNIVHLKELSPEPCTSINVENFPSTDQFVKVMS